MQQASIPPVSNSEVVKFLATTTANATFLQRLKIQYRPYVCPFDELLTYAKDAKRVYDIGCGSGQFCSLVAQFTDAQDIYGIEIDDALIRNAKHINKRFATQKKVAFSTFDGTTIPDNIKKYDLVYLIDVYHHIPVQKRDDMMRQIFDKMKPGAKLMFKDIDGASPLVLCNKMHDLVFAQEFSREISFKKAQHLLESVGFTIVERRKKRVLVYPHYFILAQK